VYALGFVQVPNRSADFLVPFGLMLVEELRGLLDHRNQQFQIGLDFLGNRKGEITEDSLDDLGVQGLVEDLVIALAAEGELLAGHQFVDLALQGPHAFEQFLHGQVGELLSGGLQEPLHLQLELGGLLQEHGQFGDDGVLRQERAGLRDFHAAAGLAGDLLRSGFNLGRGRFPGQALGLLLLDDIPHVLFDDTVLAGQLCRGQGLRVEGVGILDLGVPRLVGLFLDLGFGFARTR